MVRSIHSAPLPLRLVAPANEGGVLLAGRYRLDELLGKGGMGEVWAAYDVQLDRDVAIKLIQLKLADHPDFARRFISETRTAACLRHANIPQIYTTDRAPDGRLYMVMERVRGITLRQAIDTRGRVPAMHALCYVVQAADAVACAHFVGIYHRDIKPENIMVSEDDGRAWLLDFGIAKRTTESAGERAAAALAGRIKSTALGTIGYVPPEVARGGKADHRGDLYQLGVTLYEAISGQKPYPVPEEDTTAMLSAHVFDDPAPLPEALCPPALQAILRRLLAKEPEDRYESAVALLAALRGLFPRDAAPPSDPVAKVLNENREQQVLREAFASVPSPVESAKKSAPEGQPRTLPLAPGSAARGPAYSDQAEGERKTLPMSAGFVPVSPAHPSSARPSGVRRARTDPRPEPEPQRGTAPPAPNRAGPLPPGWAAAPAARTAPASPATRTAPAVNPAPTVTIGRRRGRPVVVAAVALGMAIGVLSGLRSELPRTSAAPPASGAPSALSPVTAAPPIATTVPSAAQAASVAAMPAPAASATAAPSATAPAPPALRPGASIKRRPAPAPAKPAKSGDVYNPWGYD